MLIWSKNEFIWLLFISCFSKIEYAYFLNEKTFHKYMRLRIFVKR